MTKLVPTEQQLNCIEMSKLHNAVRIEAVAGASKTTTLTMIAAEIVKPSIYLAFNKATADEGRAKFPPHVNCQTTHSVAFSECGKEIAHKLNRPKGHYVNVAGTGSEIAKMYKIQPIFDKDKCVVTSAAIGMFAKQSVARFEQSSDKEITLKHVVYNEHVKSLDILLIAKKLWKDRINPSKMVLATHDTYLKLYQISEPVLEYSVIYVDEFQDSTECVIDIVKRQQHAKVIIVGDSKQAIYQWRGSINGLSTYKAVECNLSKSFRFGTAIADVAMKILKNKTIVLGSENIPSVVGDVDIAQQHTMLFRTNSGLLEAAVDAIEAKMSVHIEIDTKDFTALLYSCLALEAMDTKNVKHEKVLPYADWEAFQQGCKEDAELKRMLNLVKSGKALRSIALLEQYQETHKGDKDYHILFTTAHKSKGREWDQVILSNDFPSHYKASGEWVGLNEMEENLLYVAATRAKMCLQVNCSVVEALEYCKRELLVK